MLSSTLLNICIEEALKSGYIHKLGAVIWKGRGRILSTGHNEVRSALSIPEKYRTWHNSFCAEKAAMLKVNKSKAKILVLRISAKGVLRSSKPCDSCMQMMKDYGIKEFWYADRNGQIIFERIRNDS